MASFHHSESRVFYLHLPNDQLLGFGFCLRNGTFRPDLNENTPALDSRAERENQSKCHMDFRVSVWLEKSWKNRRLP